MTPTFRIQGTHVFGLFRIKRLDLDLVRKNDVGVFFEKHFIYCHVQSRNHFLWVADQLAIQGSIKTLKVTAIQVQEWVF